MAAPLTKQQFASALADLDESFDRDRDQDLLVQGVRVKLEGAARRLREAFAGGDHDRVDAEITYITALVDELRKLEDLDCARHVSDFALWWAARPHIAFKEPVHAQA